MHWVGIIDRHGYGGQQKGIIYDARWPCPLISRTLKPVFLPNSDWFIVLKSHLDAYISRYGNFCANNEDDTTNYFTPCACVQGKYIYMYQLASPYLVYTHTHTKLSCMANSKYMYDW